MRRYRFWALPLIGFLVLASSGCERSVGYDCAAFEIMSMSVAVTVNDELYLPQGYQESQSWQVEVLAVDQDDHVISLEMVGDATEVVLSFNLPPEVELPVSVGEAVPSSLRV